VRLEVQAITSYFTSFPPWIMAQERQQNSERGFVAMDSEKQREIASKGGSESPGNFANDPGRASEAGRKGGESQSS
jgi:general stress protein YciG